MFEVNYRITEEPDIALRSWLSGLDYTRLAILVDENTEQYCLPKLPEEYSKNLIRVHSGEIHKNLDTCSHIWSSMTELGLDRGSILINLGGGVIGDMGGFCASTYKRGIRFVNLPTTLLAQVDASIGGKLGIDFEGLKNHIGVFRSPENVIVSPVFLDTLPDVELRSGFAEVLKHGLIRDQAYFNEVITHDLGDQAWADVVRHSIEIKQEVVENDPEEKGLRKVLNFGHTIGHAIESFFLETPDRLLHGEAIAIGMICESYISLKHGLLDSLDFQNVTNAILKYFPPIKIPDENTSSICNLMLQDKKNKGESILCSLITEPGHAVYDRKISLEESAEAIEYYASLKVDA